MLKKSFKPTKCKTALNLAKSRIKLMKNKKDVQMRQLRREVSQLLQNGQDQTARIRVEHVVREEKMLAAYEMIEIYCELIVARLPIIESQKNCPLDLKEAITSLIFAAPRCGDIPELQDVRKHFTAKYGKDFSTAAIELHPACGVSRILVEKLSVKAPDGPAKVKILKGIAEEYNIQWEPNWFKDEDLSSDDILKMPQTYNSYTIQAEPLNVQLANVEEKHSHSTEKPEISSQRLHTNSNEIPQSSTSRPDFSTPGNISEGMLFSHSSGTAENPFPAERQYWNMGFKDATAAAQAAADCAEQASMAARAAAQLSIRDSSHGPCRSPVHGQREGDRRFTEGVFQHKHEHETPINRSFNQRSPRMQGHQGYTDQKGDRTERRDDRSTNEEFSQSGVRYDIRHRERGESESASYRVNADRLSQSRESVSTPSTSKGDYAWSNSSNIQEYETEPAENPFHGDIVGPQNQPDKFQSQSRWFGNEYGAFSNFNHQSDEIDSDISFAGGTSAQENWHAKTNLSKFNSIKDETVARHYEERDVYIESDEKKHGFDTGSGVFVAMDQRPSGYDIDDNVDHNVANAVFDESGSDDDDDDYISPPRHSLIEKDNPHFEPDLSESFRKSSIYTKLIEPLPVTFDDYDKPSPRIVEEVQTENSDSEIGGYNHRKPARDSQGTTEFIQPSSVETSIKHVEEIQSTYIRTADESKGLESPRSFRIPSESKYHVPEFDYETYSSSEGGMELNLGSLPGGRRNRSSWRPPYTRGEFSGVSSPSKFSEAASEGFAPNEDSSPHSKFQMSSGQMGSGEVSTRNDTLSNYEAVISPSHSDIEERSYSGSFYENLHETRENDPTGYLDSDESAPEEDVPKPIVTKNVQGAGVSRRTKGSARLVSSQPSSNPDIITKSGLVSSTSYSTKDSPKRQTETSSSSSRTVDQSSWNKDATFEVRSGTKVSINNNSFSPAVVEKSPTPTIAGISRASISSDKAPSRENSGKNLSHVHPKLPDFETFAAHLKSLHKDRQ